VDRSSHFYFSNDLTALAERLRQRTRIEIERFGDPFHALTVLVPNRNVSRWLQMFFASGDARVCANIRFLYLEQGLLQMLSAVDRGRKAPNITTRQDMEFNLLESLLSGELEGRIADYVASGSARRIHQLAARFASLFQDYEYHRSDWIDGWMRQIPELLAFREQAKLYRAMRKGIQLRDPAARTLREYSGEVLSGSPTTPPDRVFVFGISQISDLHLRILFDLSDWIDIDLYLLDMIAAAGISDEWRITDHISNIKLDGIRAWLEPQLRLLESMQAIKKEHHAWFSKHIPRANATSLSIIQNAIVGQVESQAGIEDTVQMIGCPGPFREIETVYQSIIFQMEKDPTLRLTDVAILVPDIKAYRGAIESVFEREVDSEGRPVIPFSITDFTSAQASIYKRGVAALFELIDGDFTRSQVFSLLLNPCFQEAWNVARELAAGWPDIAERLGIFQGTDSVYGFQAGLRRLRMSYAMYLEEGDFGGCVPFEDPYVDEKEVGILSNILSTLFEAIEQIRSASPLELPDCLRSLFNRFLAVPDSLSEERRIEEKVLGILLRLKTFHAKFEIAIVRDLVLEAASSVSASRGEYLASGVTISALQPMRPIPFRITYVVGLGEGKFPGKADESEMNLRNLFPAPGDIALPDANRLLLLEALVSARDRIVFTFNCRDLQRDAEFEPSTALRELASFAESIGTRIQFDVVPLHSSSIAMEEKSFLRVSPREQTLTLLRALPGEKTRAWLSSEIRKRSLYLKPPGRASLKERSRIDLKRLSEYLERPLDSVIRDAGLRDEDAEDLALKDREPFFSGSYLMRMLPAIVLREFLREKNRSEEKLRKVMQTIHAKYARKLRLPLDAFGEVDRINVLDRLRDVRESLEESLRPDPFKSITIASRGGGIDLATGAGSIEISGSLESCWVGDNVIECVVVASGKTYERHWIYPFLFYLARVCAEDKEIAFTVHRISVKDGEHDSKTFRPVDVARASTYLTELATDFLSANIEFVPFALVDRAPPGEFLPELYSSELQAIIDDPDADRYSYSELADLIEPQITKNAHAKALGRFELFFEVLQ